MTTYTPDQLREIDAAVRTIRKCAWCGDLFSALRCYRRRGQMKYCSHPCSSRARRKRNGFEFNGAWFATNANGYYVASINGCDVLFHRLVWENQHGKIPAGMVVHHRDGDKTNNELVNLELMEWGRHTALHCTGRPSTTRGRPKCIVAGCDRSNCAQGMCTMHYQRKMAAAKGRWP